MVKQRHDRERLHELVSSCQVISEYAALADLPEVDDLLSQLLFVLTDGAYGSERPGGTASDPGGSSTGQDAVDALRHRIRALGEASAPKGS